ncbi:energy-converting hydrogenase B subunit K [Dehalogenimonas formicexedens]|uniref:Energy-converting hydrogenase B subunit K n=1 Tax=Dehalogenimonas formicexedens TaxID=1839801 RepID=A0A1P8F7I3_9CHLR|nr:4Fe-4S binding protein [Dehalogenimonas formicexedens]APV44446.1 energy-converting hydrogenase B subunit K [Dehalogenimonas formicexedens]
MINIEINQNLCDHCNLCIASCPSGGIIVSNGKVVADASADCRDCRTCESICGRNAINWYYEIVLNKPVPGD